MTINDRDRLVTIPDLPEVLGVPIDTLYGWRYRGLGAAGYRVGHVSHTAVELRGKITLSPPAEDDPFRKVRAVARSVMLRIGEHLESFVKDGSSELAAEKSYPFTLPQAPAPQLRAAEHQPPVDDGGLEHQGSRCAPPVDRTRSRSA